MRKLLLALRCHVFTNFALVMARCALGLPNAWDHTSPSGLLESAFSHAIQLAGVYNSSPGPTEEK